MDPEKKSLNLIFPTKYVIPKSLKFGHWLSEPFNLNLNGDDSGCLFQPSDISKHTPTSSSISKISPRYLAVWKYPKYQYLKNLRYFHDSM